ncbi:hypothetical protein Tsubulata_013898 [Turnera subulata]|uniref:N-acetyltransferase domain-containing protein n=1 Tax=Turnera subulata TaxID=218843 RepID=A0A9Q0J3K0_9ROSI|nr:hypothetical protein Tsubulata_013898 [Turnera subulata]
MQSKISSFFKASSTSTDSSSSSSQSQNPPPPVSADGDDELALWENTKHHFYNTYKRRTPKLDTVDKRMDLLGKPNSEDAGLRPEMSRISGKVLNKKRSYAQFHLDLGQSDFNFRECSTCGINYVPGDEGDEKEHKSFHKKYTHGIQFKIFKNERVVDMPCTQKERVLLVLHSDPPALRNKVQEVIKMMEIELGGGWIFHNLCKVYLFISANRVAGCVVAEPIKEAFKVLTHPADGSSNGTTTTIKCHSRPNSTTLQFGQIIFHREASTKPTSVNSAEALNEKHDAVIVCEEAVVPAVCGIRAVWVTPSNRRKRIATQLLDAVRRSFCMGIVLEQSQLAFSAPNSAGRELASSFTGTSSFLVYKPNAFCST